jgi:hypothetical protein
VMMFDHNDKPPFLQQLWLAAVSLNRCAFFC